MPRPRTPIGTFGEIYYEKAPGGRVRAFARFRDHDGQLRRVQTTASTQQAAARRLKKLLAERAEQSVGQGELLGSSSFRHLVEVWLADLDLENKLAPSTRDLYERNMEKLVMPAFANYTLREITVRKVDQFIKTLASTKSYSTAKQARTVLSLAFGLAVRYDAIPRNPVRDTVRLQKPPSQAQALTVEQIDVIRTAARSWRRGSGFAGPPPDGQLEQVIEVMLGTSARIGEVLAIRKCDVDVTERGQTRKPYPSAGPAIFAGHKIQFRAKFASPGHSVIWWQVTNTGAHAERDSSLRGGFLKAKSITNGISRDPAEHWENTAYTGTHRVRALLVRDSTVVAVSDWHVVNIWNSGFRLRR